uniref:Uncharacterized protein n=1 Tax=Pristionchus pacificus TaxID=54126 RepID=A0A2A6C1P5_PRIPA|eukprot:PDM72028.1 hypothetical protein PRIPAC_38435 [Pristionchus pacificus]
MRRERCISVWFQEGKELYRNESNLKPVERKKERREHRVINQFTIKLWGLWWGLTLSGPYYSYRNPYLHFPLHQRVRRRVSVHAQQQISLALLVIARVRVKDLPDLPANLAISFAIRFKTTIAFMVETVDNKQGTLYRNLPYLIISSGARLLVVFMLHVNRSDRGLTSSAPPPARVKHRYIKAKISHNWNKICGCCTAAAPDVGPIVPDRPPVCGVPPPPPPVAMPSGSGVKDQRSKIRINNLSPAHYLLAFEGDGRAIPPPPPPPPADDEASGLAQWPSFSPTRFSAVSLTLLCSVLPWKVCRLRVFLGKAPPELFDVADEPPPDAFCTRSPGVTVDEGGYA